MVKTHRHVKGEGYKVKGHLVQKSGNRQMDRQTKAIALPPMHGW